ncbi:MAG TPA: DUF4936 family protein [Burkholderiales bacterium]
MTNYYVYYRVDAANVDAVRLSVEELFKVIERQTGVRGRWMHRRDDPLTYMEVYEEVKDERAFEAALERESAKFGLERKIERFACV